MSYTDQQTQIMEAIESLDKAIEFFQKKNIELCERSVYGWTKEMEQLTILIEKLAVARKRLYDQWVMRERLQIPLLDTEMLTNLIVERHEAYKDWRV